MSLDIVLVLVNEKLLSISDSYQVLTNQTSILLNGLINQTKQESEIRKDYCEICLVRRVKFHGHHIAGQYNDFRQITVCTNCHYALTLRQQLDRRIWSPNNPDSLKQAFFLRGLYDVLVLMSQKRNDSIYARLADSLVGTIYDLQGAQN